MYDLIQIHFHFLVLAIYILHIKLVYDKVLLCKPVTIFRR